MFQDQASKVTFCWYIQAIDETLEDKMPYRTPNPSFLLLNSLTASIRVYVRNLTLCTKNYVSNWLQKFKLLKV